MTDRLIRLASVKTIHDIVTPDRIYPAGRIVDDMPRHLVDETGTSIVKIGRWWPFTRRSSTPWTN